MWVVVLLLTSGICSARVVNHDSSETANGGGFLSSELPFEVVRTAPHMLSYASTQTLRMRGEQQLEVQFSRSVIALGQDFGAASLPDDKIPFFLEPEVPGRFRWVTTYVARWDPHESWPLDSEIKFTFNKNLKTYDGILLQGDVTGRSVVLTTPSLSMSIASVKSERASRLTDGHWESDTGLESDMLPEVPPDGVIRLSFDAKVSLTALQNNLKVLDESSKEPAEGLGIKVQPCDSPESDRFVSPKPCLRCKVPLESQKSEEENDCVEVSIEGDLKMETRYSLFLGEGVKYSENSGALKAAKSVNFGGLRKFKIPFLSGPGEHRWISTNFLPMWLPHGLEKTAESDMRALKKQFTISTKDGNEVDFDLELVDNSTLRILASFTPGTDYKISVDSSGDILDGFGLPLEASSINIWAWGVRGEFTPFLVPGGYAIFEAGENWGRKIVAGFKGNPGDGCLEIEGNIVNIHPVADSQIRTVAAYLKSQYVTAQLSKTLGLPAGKLKQEEKGTTEVVEFDIGEYFSQTGLVATEYCSDNLWAKTMVINESDMQAIILGSENGQSIVWVTSMKTGNPIEGARVTLFEEPPYWHDSDEFPNRVATATTDGEGKAIFDGLSRADFAHVEFRNKSFFVKDIPGGYDDVKQKSVSLVLDRRVVQPGETLHIKGYSRGKNLAKHATVYMFPAFDSESSDTPAFTIEFGEKFGTFELEIPVPENAGNKDYVISCQAKHIYLASEVFTVGEPRLPTTALTLAAPFWAKPDSKVTVNISAESFIGAAAGDAKITLKWSIPSDDDSDEKVEGEIEAVTDSLGKVSSEIDLGSLPKIPSAKQTLEIEVSWIGPTRELLKETASVLLRNADVEIRFHRTVESDFPGQEFGVKISLTDLKGEPLEDRMLVVNLKQISNPEISNGENLPSTSSQPLEEPIADSCEIQSNSEGYECRFSIPDLAIFALETCVETEKNSREEFCGIATLGKTPPTWTEDGPLDQHLEIGLVSLTEGPHSVGDRLKFAIENPYRNAKALVMWRSHLGTDHMMMPINDSSLHEFSIDLDEHCVRGCTLSVAVAVPRQTEGIPMNPQGVPIAKLFDLAMPHATELTSDIEVHTDTPLDVEITFPDIREDKAKDFVVSPGETTSIQVKIAEIAEAEVTVMAVDKAILELLPLALKDVTKDLEMDCHFSTGFASSGADLISPGAIETMIQDFRRKKEVDPWFRIAYDMSLAHDYMVEQTEQQYVDSRSDFITVGGRSLGRYGGGAGDDSCSGGGCGCGGGRGTGGGGGGGGGGGFDAPPRIAATPPGFPLGKATSRTLSSVRVLEDFVSTALFETVVAKDGFATINFMAPDNLGTFNVRAYVATESEKYGSVEKELIVRRAISLTPSAPRFARVGDEFEAGAVVTVSGANPSDANVSIAIDLLNGLSLEVVGESKRAVKVGKDGTKEVRFRFKAKQMGDAKFKISADIGPSASDALVINFPVEGGQDAVTVATSFAIDGSSSSRWQEGLRLPQAVPGSGGVAVRAGVGRMPAVLSMAGQIYESNPKNSHKCPIYADFALALVTIPFVTETYKVLDLEPSSLDQDTLEVINGIQSNFTSGLKSLEEMSSRRFDPRPIGLDYSLTCKRSRWILPMQPSLYMNARGVLLLTLLKEDLDTLEREVVKSGIPSLKSLKREWASALATALLREEHHDPPVNIGSLALARAGLGGDWVPPSKTSDLSMERLSKEFDSMGVESQTYYILTRISMERGETHPDIQKAIDVWTSNFRVTGRTAYIAKSEGSSTPASNIANSLALIIMVKAKVDNLLLGKLANYVSSPPVSHYGFRVFSDFDKAVAMIALRNYDVFRGSDQPDLKLEVTSGESSLIDARFTGSASPVASSSTPWEELASPPDPLEFRADGTGEVTLAAMLTFVPATLLLFPTYRGIFVQRSISIAASEEHENKASLKTIPVTSVVEVSVQITTPDRLGTTTVRVLMPAGLEPVDPNIDGSSSCPGAFFFFSPRCEQETEPSVVTFRFNSLTSGTHTLSFRAVAATAGTFALPPVKAFVNEQPEVMGLSPGGELEICSGARCVAVEDASPKPPKSCPNDCSDNGTCDLASGACMCFDGFKGADCGDLTGVFPAPTFIVTYV